VLFLIRSLARGGAERQLAELATGLDPRQFDVTVLTFYPGGAVWEELAAGGAIRLTSLNKRGRWDVAGFALRLARALRTYRPAILHTYMVEPSVFGLIIGRIVGVPLIVWGVRASNVRFADYDRMTGVMFRVAARLSRFADVMIANSEAGRTYHLAHGYAPRSSVTIPNGIDTDRFVPSPSLRAATRRAYRVDAGDVLIGLAARLDPMKGHDVFLRAARVILGQFRAARFVCIGSGAAAHQMKLQSLAQELSIADRVVWIPEHPRMSEIYPALDVACSASVHGEGFSNAIGEAMACGVPCVVTDCGDASRIVGKTGVVVPPGDADALAMALLGAIRLDQTTRFRMGAEARRRIIECFGVDVMVARTAAVYADSAAVALAL
jgi:glycosyltransferase involved in cell wall biosynthesis